MRVEPTGAASLYGSEQIAAVAVRGKRRAKQEASGFVLLDGGESTASLQRQAEAETAPSMRTDPANWIGEPTAQFLQARNQGLFS